MWRSKDKMLYGSCIGFGAHLIEIYEEIVNGVYSEELESMKKFAYTAQKTYDKYHDIALENMLTLIDSENFILDSKHITQTDYSNDSLAKKLLDICNSAEGLSSREVQVNVAMS